MRIRATDIVKANCPVRQMPEGDPAVVSYRKRNVKVLDQLSLLPSEILGTCKASTGKPDSQSAADF
jgi:hypothetical protein